MLGRPFAANIIFVLESKERKHETKLLLKPLDHFSCSLSSLERSDYIRLGSRTPGCWKLLVYRGIRHCQQQGATAIPVFVVADVCVVGFGCFGGFRCCCCGCGCSCWLLVVSCCCCCCCCCCGCCCCLLLLLLWLVVRFCSANCIFGNPSGLLKHSTKYLRMFCENLKSHLQQRHADGPMLCIYLPHHLEILFWAICTWWKSESQHSKHQPLSIRSLCKTTSSGFARRPLRKAKHEFLKISRNAKTRQLIFRFTFSLPREKMKSSL